MTWRLAKSDCIQLRTSGIELHQAFLIDDWIRINGDE
jgi:hypothetical protein